jgi:hypothetical protein
MFMKHISRFCGTDVYHNIRLNALEHLSFEEEVEACRYAVGGVEVTDTLT